jgi:hypothetical protein
VTASYRDQGKYTGSEFTDITKRLVLVGGMKLYILFKIRDYRCDRTMDSLIKNYLASAIKKWQTLNHSRLMQSLF